MKGFEFDELFSFSNFKETISLIPGSIIKHMKNKKNCYIINNIFEQDVEEDELKKGVSFMIKKNNENREIKVDCFFATNMTVDKKINITCSDDNIEDAETIQIKGFLTSSEINFKDFEDLYYYTVTLGKILKGSYDSNTKIYSFILRKTTISKTFENLNKMVLFLCVY